MFKNIAGQKWTVFAFNKTTNDPVEGDSANITADMSLDNGTLSAVTDTNPTEVGNGYYRFDITQVECNANKLEIFPESTTENVIVIGVPAVCSTKPQYFSDMNIESDGNLALLDSILADTGTDLPVQLTTIQEYIENLSIGAAGLSVKANSVTVTIGTPTGTYTNTHEADESYYAIADVAGEVDIYFEFDVGEDGVPSSMTFLGYSEGKNDPMKVFGYNWEATSWEQIGTIPGGDTVTQRSFNFYIAHVGTGADVGKVRLRFYNTGLSSSNLAIDQLFVTFSNNITLAGVNSEVDTALLDAALATAADVAVIDSNVDLILEDTGTDLPTQLTEIQTRLNTFSIGAAGLSVVSDSANITTGTPTGSYTNTHEADAVYHQIADATGVLDVDYLFNISGTGAPSTMTILGSVEGQNDNVGVYGYNWGTTSWEQIGTIPGGGVDTERTFSLYAAHVGTGADLGKVRVRFYGTGLTSATLYIDQLYVTFANNYQSVGYSNGAIWIDTVNGTSGTTPFVNGTADNPLNSWADVLTLSASTGIKKFTFAAGSSVVLTDNSDSYVFEGDAYIVNLNGQSVSGASFKRATILGDDSGINAIPTYYERCIMSTHSLGQHTIRESGLTGTVTFAESGTYVWNNCQRIATGVSNITVDFGTIINDISLLCSDFTGVVEVVNMGQAGSDALAFGGVGTLILNSNCVGGELFTAGIIDLKDNSGGAVSISEYVLSTPEEMRKEMDANSTKLASLLEDTDTTIPGLIAALNNLSEAQVNEQVDIALVDYGANKTVPPTVEEIRLEIDSASTQLATLTTRLSELRAGFLDKLNVTGTLANSDAADTYKADVSSLATEAALGIVDTLVDEIKVIIDNLPDSGTLSSLATSEEISNLNNPSIIDIVDGIFDEVLPDISADGINVGEDITPRKLFRAMFNRLFRKVTQTASLQTVYNDNGDVIAEMDVSYEPTTQTQIKDAAK